jgi:hypothetical protein
MAGAPDPPFDPYVVLGVPVLASPDEIHRAYRALARLHHPDLNPDDPASATRFAQATQAFELLSDEVRRSAFDLVRAAPHGPRAARAAPGPTGNVQVRGPGAVPAHRIRVSSSVAEPRSVDPDPLAVLGTLAKASIAFVVVLMVAIAIVAFTRPPVCAPGVPEPCRVVDTSTGG